MNAPGRVYVKWGKSGDTRVSYMQEAFFGPIDVGADYVRADLVDGVENEWRKDWEAEKARADRAEAERDRVEWAAVTADGKIRHALPTRFVLVPPDGGNVETLEAVQETVKALDRAEAEHMETLGRLAGNVAKVAELKALLREAVEAARQLRIIAGMDLMGASAVAYNAARDLEAAIARAAELEGKTDE